MPIVPLAQGPSYSDMVEKQVGLINRQREANLENRLAQQEKNREFKTEQLQGIYDFDVSGLSPAHAKAIKVLQEDMANSLDFNSDDSYESSKQLTADIAFLNNVFLTGKRYNATGSAASKGYQDKLTNKVNADGSVSVGNEDTFDNRLAAFNQGGFDGDLIIGGTAGNRTITGVPLSEGEDGVWMGQGEAVNFFDNPLMADSSPLFRMENIAADPFLDQIQLTAAENKNIQKGNTQAQAEQKFNTSRITRETIRREEYDLLFEADSTKSIDPLEELDEKGLKLLGLDDASLISKVKDRMDKAVASRPQTTPEPIFDFQRSISGMPVLIDDIDIVSENEELAGKIKSAEFVKGLNLEDLNKDSNGNPIIPIEVGYVRSGILTKVILNPAENPDEFQQLIQGLTGSGLEELLRRSGYGAENEIEVGAGNVEGIADGEEGAKKGTDAGNVEGIAEGAFVGYEKMKKGLRSGLSVPEFLRTELGRLVGKLKGKSISDQINLIEGSISSNKENLDKALDNPNLNKIGKEKKAAIFEDRISKLEELKLLASNIEAEGNYEALSREKQTTDLRSELAEKEQELENYKSRYGEDWNNPQISRVGPALAQEVKDLKAKLQEIEASLEDGLSDEFLSVLQEYSLQDEFTPADLLDYVRGISDPKKQAETQNTIISIYNNGKFPYLNKTTGEILSSDTLT